MLYKSTNKLLLGYKKFNVPLFTFREPPLKWKNNVKLQNVMVAIKTVQTFSNESIGIWIQSISKTFVLVLKLPGCSNLE